MSMVEKKRALLIGNNNYSGKGVTNLKGCHNDVNRMKEVLETHGKGDPNFSVCDHTDLSNDRIKKEIEVLLKRDATYGLLYFSGHGRKKGGSGLICGTDTEIETNLGVSMDWILCQINASKVLEITIILDCCHAGAFGNVEFNEFELSTLRKGVTILAATTKDDVSIEFLKKGIFTTILYDGLKGAAADTLGHVTPVGLYNCAESILNPWKQRPVFKSSVDQMTPLRFCLPDVKKRIIRQICDNGFFPDKAVTIKLSKSMLESENDRHQNYLTLSAFAKSGLLSCPDRKTLIESTLNEESCQLSAYGKHIWELAKNKRI